MPPKRGKWQAPRGRGASYRGRSTPFRGNSRFNNSSHTTGWWDSGGYNNSSTSSRGYGQSQSHGFSMADEARNTAARHNWDVGDLKLRFKPVTFISAGSMNPLEEILTNEPSPGDGVDGQEGVEDAHPSTNADPNITVYDSTPSERSLQARDVEMSAVETKGTDKPDAAMESIQQDSLVDVTGDRVETISNQDQPAKGTAQSFDDLFVLDTTGDETVEIPNLPPPKIPSLRASPEISDSSDEEVIVFKGRANRHVVQPPTSSRPNPISTIHPADNTAGSSVEGPSSQGNDRIDIEVAHDPQPEKGSKSKRRRTRAVDKEAEEEEDAILADYIANMAEDSDNDDFLSSALRAFAGGRDLGGDHHAVNFGSDHEISPYNQDVANEEKSKASEDSEAGSDAEQMEDGDMDEDIISQLITKHEALEIGDNDLFSFMTSHTKLKTKTNYRQRPSASQVADALDSLDLGDWDQMAAAQSRKRKGKKQPPKFNVDDPEIEAALRIAWQKDRERKKERKLEREALRAEGLLGKNANPDSLSVKYPTGMKLEDMKAELCSFLLGDVDRLEFPPLDKHARKILHELASKFEIKSQSIGSGDQRRPVLHRTKRTIRFSDLQCKEVSIHVDKAATRIYRKYFHRTDLKGGGEGKNSPKPAGGRSSYKALTPREGEIVGASVPELGADNKGRAMLEKMGWTKGMALGAADNKGILVPVVQVVKRSKAGLG